MARQSIRQILLFVLAAASIAVGGQAARAACGSVVTLPAHDGTTQNYSLAGDAKSAKAALVLLVGGGGHIAMDDGGCATKLKGNSLIRQRDAFHAGGMVTALLDAPSDHHEQDGLGGFRLDPRHADDIGKVIADVRAKTGLPVWVASTSRGTISAANAAARLSGAAAPDGVILTSPLTKGFAGGRKPWVAQDVFKLDLSAIKAPLLVIVQERDTCIRTPPELGARSSRTREVPASRASSSPADRTGAAPRVRPARAAHRTASSTSGTTSPPAWCASSRAAATERYRRIGLKSQEY
jgi:hypothetical protein